MTRNILSFLLCFFYLLPVFSQDKNTLCIHIKGLEEGKAIPYSTVVYMTSAVSHIVKADNFGKACFDITDSKELRVKVTSLGYQSVDTLLKSYNKQEITILMHKLYTGIDAINIWSMPSKSEIAIRRSLTKREMTLHSNKSLGGIIQNVTGVTNLSTGSTIMKPMIHGLHSQRLAIINNGIRHMSQEWGAEHAPEIDVSGIENISIEKGAVGLRYGGDALAGTIILHPPALVYFDEYKKLKTLLHYGSNGHSYKTMLQYTSNLGSDKNLAYQIQGSYGKNGNLKTADYYLDNTGTKEKGLNFRLGFNKGSYSLDFQTSHYHNEIGIYSGAHLGSIEELEARLQTGRPSDYGRFNYHIEAPRQDVSHHTYSVSYKRTNESQSTFEASYSLQQNSRKEFDRRRIESDLTPMADMALTTQNIELFYRTGPFQTALQASNQVNNNVAGTGTTPIIPNYDSYTFGLFGALRINTSRIKHEVGIRYDIKHLDVAGYKYEYDKTNEEGVVPHVFFEDRRYFHHLSAQWASEIYFSDNMKLKNQIGMNWRAPSVNELYTEGLHHGSGTYEIGRADLKSEAGIKWSSSLDFKSDLITIEFDPFVQFINRYIYADPDPDSIKMTIRGAFPIFRYRQKDALFYGLDLKVVGYITPYLEYHASISTVYAQEIKDKTFLPYIPPMRMKQGLSYSFGKEKAKSSYIQILHLYTSKQTRYQQQQDFVQPPPSHHIWNLNIYKNIPIKQNNLGLQVSVENLFNKSYKDYMNRLHYFQHELGRNISISIHSNF